MAVKELQSSRKNTVPLSRQEHYKKLANKSKKKLRKNYGTIKSDLKEMRKDMKK
ncbi:hypothetical protein [Aquibacillus albus]|uniref:Uncharacterized protein n=1 Tax=Aquibacillus albus TaxID=1168171 RepID=A0ABS2N3I8_9BACI|nr:hypothetical protein [Aquibacillus albus]MBM7572687.1 hypothetical protein [Aquibacillus albus]